MFVKSRSLLICFFAMFIVGGSVHPVVVAQTTTTTTTPQNMLDLKAANLPGLLGERDTLYGESITGIGDYNHDGYGDMIIGGRAWNGWQGKVWIYYGSPQGPSTKADFTIIGEPNIQDSGICMGHTVVNLGDVNGDGINDFAAGGPGSWGGWDVGRLYIFYGNPQSTPSKASQSNQNLTSPIKFDWFAESFTRAGDFNGDGYNDLIVGAPGTSNPADGSAPFETGHAYIFLGSPNGFSQTPDITMRDTLNYTAFGLVVGGEGDVNGDGYSDVMVGASWTNNHTGRAFLYTGSANPDPNPTPAITFTGPTEQSNMGFFVRILKDVNNDGYDDIAVKYTNTTGDQYQGLVNIYYGRPDLTNLTTPDIVLKGNDFQDDFGYVFNNVGDLNNDGYNDFAVGAPGTIYGQTGKVYVYYTGPNFDNKPDRIYVGENGGDKFGYWVAGTDLDGDNKPDLLMSALYYDQIGKVYIDLSGNGTLRAPPTEMINRIGPTLLFVGLLGGVIALVVVMQRKQKINLKLPFT